MMQVQLPDFDNVAAGAVHQTFTWSLKLPAGVTIVPSGPVTMGLTIGTVPERSTGTDPTPQSRQVVAPVINAPVTNADGTTQQSISAVMGGWIGGVTYLFTLVFNLSTGDDGKIFNHAFCVAPK